MSDRFQPPEDPDQLRRLVDRYVRNQMTPVEQRAFETWFLDQPSVVEDVEIGQLLAQALKNLVNGGPPDDG